MTVVQDIARLRECLERWDRVPSGPAAFAVHQEIVTFLLEGRAGDTCNWHPLRRLLDAASTDAKEGT